MADAPAIEQAGIPSHIQSLFREFFESTWFKLRDDPQLVQTRRGSRPGDSFADLCFSFALVKIVGLVTRDVVAQFPDVRIGWNNSFSPVPTDEVTTWVAQ